MLDPFGIVGVVVVAGQIISTVANFGLDWKHAPADTRSLLVAVGALKTVLSETNMNILLNDDFKDAFHGRHSTLLSQLGDTVPVTDTSMLVLACKKELEILLEDLQKRVQGHRIGWKRMKGAFLAKTTKEAVQSLHRQCQTLNTLMDMDTLVVGVSIHKEVREARREQQGWHADKECKAIIGWLTVIDYGPKQSDFIARRQEGTGQWLLSSLEYREWSETAGQTLFCPGIPGAGKTIITSIVVDDLCTRYTSNEHVGIAYIYCDFQRQQEQKVGELLMSLLKQLTQRRSSLPECVKFLHDEHWRKRTRPSFDEISRTLRRVADSYSRTFIIVDALDECQQNDGCRARFLTELFNLQAECGANIFATSRCIPEITERFSASTRLEIRANDEDVRRYLDGRILQSRRTSLEKCREEIRNGITEVSDGMFLLAHLHFESVSKKKTTRSIKGALKSLLTGLEAYNQVYEEAWVRITESDTESQDLAKKVLSWITCAKRQLTTSEIQHALAIQEGDSELEEEGIPSVSDMVSVCVGMVETDEESGIIRLVHRTAQEYFQRILPNAETDIAKACLTYLSFGSFRNGFCPTGQDVRDQQLLDPFFEYAAQNWVLHARSASSDVQPLISTFLSSGSKVPSSCLLWAVKNQQELIAEWLLERRVDTNVRDADWKTPLHHAVIHGWKKCVQLLLSYEATKLSNLTTDINNMTPIHYTVAKANGEIAQVLLDAGVSVDSLVKRRIWLATCQDGKLTYAPNSNLCCCQGGFNAPQGLTALHYAALTGSAQMTRYFLDHGANPNAVSECGETPLHLAVRQDIHDWKRPFGKRDDWNNPDLRIEVLLDLIDHGTDDEEEYSKIMRIINKDRVDIIDALLNHPDIDVNTRDTHGATLLHCVPYGNRGSQSILERLLEKNVKMSQRDSKGRTPLHLACLARDVTSITALIKHGASVMDLDEGGLNTLHCAARSGDGETIQLLLDFVTDGSSMILATARDRHDRNALHHLLGRHDGVSIDAVRSLLSSSVGINDLDDRGYSPLAVYLAKSSFPLGKAQVVRLLFERGADASFKSPKAGFTLGHLSAKSFRLDEELLSVLASSGVDLHMKDATGRTVLHHAAMAGSLTEDALEFLYNDMGLSRGSRDSLGLTPLDHAIEMRKKDRHRDTFDRDRWLRTEEILRHR